VTQAAGAATFTISPMTWSPPAVGGTQALAVTASYADATWTATSSAAWLTLSASGGAGGGIRTIGRISGLPVNGRPVFRPSFQTQPPFLSTAAWRCPVKTS
jgi:hypothetical protein